MVSIVKPTYAGRVKVAVIFENGKIRPVWFVPDTARSAGERIMISKVNLQWESRKGSGKIINFGVTAGGNDYTLAFDTDDFTWSVYVREESSYNY